MDVIFRLSNVKLMRLYCMQHTKMVGVWENQANIYKSLFVLFFSHRETEHLFRLALADLDLCHTWL